jgi:hypothetical protein
MAMAGGERKGWLGGSTRFGVGDALTAEEQESAPLLPLTLELSVTAPHRDGGMMAAVEIRQRRFLGVALDAFSLEMPLG